MPYDTLALAADLATTVALDVMAHRAAADDATLQQWPHLANRAHSAARAAEDRIIRFAEMIERAASVQQVAA